MAVAGYDIMEVSIGDRIVSGAISHIGIWRLVVPAFANSVTLASSPSGHTPTKRRPRSLACPPRGRPTRMLGRRVLCKALSRASDQHDGDLLGVDQLPGSGRGVTEEGSKTSIRTRPRCRV